MATGRIVTTCPRCEKKLKADESSIGRQVRCPECRASFTVTTVAFGSTASMSIQADDRDAVSSESVSGSGDGATRQAAAEPTIGKVGRFELKTLLGVGGFGKVYRAYDPVVDRHVALKVPRFETTEKRKIRRFLTEAKAAASLRHPNIVALFESGRANGRYFIATEYVEGQPLSERLLKGKLKRATVARWVRSLAEALHYAHTEGIVHRDIKPENVMLDRQGRPQIMDFGLAKRVEEDSSMTADGNLLGTPAYMSPEQARGELSKVGPASDQYSLGVVLYELLTGQKPFDGPPHVVIAKVIGEEPPRPRTIDDTIPEDLEAICLKAMEKESARRFDDAQLMADDLGHWLEGYETLARPIGRLERLRRWAGRNRLVAALGAAVLVLLTVGLTGVSWQWLRAERALALVEPETRRANENEQQALQRAAEAESARQAAERAKNEALAETKAKEDALARLEPETRRANENAAKAREALQESEAARDAAVFSQVNSEVTLARSLCEQKKIADGLLWYAHALNGVTNLPERNRAALDHLIRRELASWHQHVHRPRFVYMLPGEIFDVAFSPDGKFFALASSERSVLFFDSASGVEALKPLEHDAQLTSLAFNSDGTILITGCNNGSVRRWNLQTRQVIGNVLSHERRVNDIVVTSDDKYVIVATGDTASCWNLASGQLVKTMKDTKENGVENKNIRSVAVSADGAECYVAGGDTLGIYNLGSRQPGRLLVEDWQPERLATGPNSGRIAAVGYGDFRLWDPKTSREISTPIVQKGPGRDVTFSADEKLIAIGTVDGTVRVSNVSDGQQVGQTLYDYGVNSIAFSPSERILLFASKLGRVWVWEIAKGTRPIGVVQPEIDSESRRITVIPPTENQVIVADRAGSLQAFSLTTGEPTGNKRVFSSELWCVGFNHDASLLAVGEQSGLVSILEWPSGPRPGRTVMHDGPVFAVGFADQGTQVFSAGNGHVQFWESDSLAAGQRYDHADVVSVFVVTTSNRRMLYTVSQDMVRIWDRELGVQIAEPIRFRSIAKDMPHGYPEAFDVAVAPNGTKLVVGRDQLFIRLRDGTTGQPIVELPGLAQTGHVLSTEFSPDGKLLATGTIAGDWMLWDTGTGRPIGLPTKSHGPWAIEFIEDGTKVVISDFHRLGIYRVPRPLGGTPQQLGEWLTVETRMELLDDGTIRILDGHEWLDRKGKLEPFDR